MNVFLPFFNSLSNEGLFKTKIVCFLYLTVHVLSPKLSKKFVVIFADRPLIRIALL